MQNEIEQKIYSIIKARTSFTDSFSLELTNEIAAAIAPLVDAGSGTGKCKGCIKNEGELLHACPYLEWRDCDEETACNCCEQCKQDCKDRIGEL